MSLFEEFGRPTLAGFARGCFDLVAIVFALTVPPYAVVQLYLAITG